MISTKPATASLAMLFALLCGAPACVRAQQEQPAADTVAPSTQPVANEPVEQRIQRQRIESFSGRGEPRAGEFRGEPRGEFRGDGGWRGLSPMDIEEEPTPEEWDEVAAFTQKFSPKRWDMFMQLPEAKRDPVRRFMYWRYKQVTRMREDDPALFELHTRRLTIEDAIFPLAWTIRRADGDETDEVVQAREQLRKHVADLVEVGLKERELRLERMKRRHLAEAEQLSIDRGRQEQLVDERIELITRPRSGGPWMGGGDGPRRPFVGGPEGRAGEPIGGPRPPEPAPAP